MIGWSYDAAGNLLSDGTTTRSYDALNRLVAQAGTSYTYNGDGVLVSDGTTTYAQDLAAPLSQVLSDGTANYVYGHDRLRALSGPWYVGDTLGSVRQTLDDAGGVLATTSYDPWGTPQGTLSAPFGFTGELHSAGQIYLRARWYAPGQGRFVSEDPFAGFAELPYSLHAYQYAYSNPVVWTDPSGECPTCTPSPVPAPTPDPTVPPVTPTPTTPPVPPPGPVMGNGSHCIAGFFKQVAYNTTLGLADVAAPVSGESVAMTVCRQVGNAWSVVQGGAEFLGGGTLAVGGVVACGTGVLCIAGAPAALVGTGLATHGAGVAVMGTWQLVAPLGVACMAASSGAGGGGGSPTPSPQPNPGPASSSTNGPYSHIQDSSNVAQGKDFTPTQKENIIKENMLRNNGIVRSDLSGETLVRPSKSKKGVIPPQNEWQIDHILPKDKGGTNSYSNAQVLSRAENRAKWNK